jgi:hypothetical protein
VAPIPSGTSSPASSGTPVVVVTMASAAQAKLPVTGVPPASTPSNVPARPPSATSTLPVYTVVTCSALPISRVMSCSPAAASP